MSDRPKLRVVGEEERIEDTDPGNIQVVLEDLATAHGMVVEATAEALELRGDNGHLVVQLTMADTVLRQARKAAQDYEKGTT